MSSRQEEKEARRREREAQAQAAEQQAARGQRLRLAGGVVLALLAVGGIAFAVAGGGDDHSAGPKADGGDNLPKVELPAAKITNLQAAVKAAKCELKEQLASEGRDHTTKPVTSYKTNPPTSGPHNPEWAQDGEYGIGSEPDTENWVHALEHGRILFQFAPGTSKADEAKLSALFNEDFSGSNGYHQLLFQNTSKMPFKFAAVAWTNYLGCPGPLDSATIDAFRAFRAKYVDKGPELIP